MTTAIAIRKPAKPRRPLYLAAPIDSIALGEEAEALLRQHPRHAQWPVHVTRPHTGGTVAMDSLSFLDFADTCEGRV